MTFKIIGTTLLAAAGVCGSAAAVEARGHSRGERFSRRERGESNFARDFRPRRRRGAAAAWDDRGR
jgi:hypothetical protein